MCKTLIGTSKKKNQFKSYPRLENSMFIKINHGNLQLSRTVIFYNKFVGILSSKKNFNFVKQGNHNARKNN